MYGEKKYKIINVENKNNKNHLKRMLNWIFIITICFVISYFINTVFFLNAIVVSGSMENTINTDDRIFASKFAYTFDEPKRLDIIVFKFPDDESTLFVKRVIGLPGDKVEIDSGKVYINDELLVEDYIKGVPTKTFGVYNVPEGHYFVLGDHRVYSYDSRFWDNTYVPRENIVAKPFYVYSKKEDQLTETYDADIYR
ncbi:MAG: signal peptidase I [Lachnospirales bacterium]